MNANEIGKGVDAATDEMLNECEELYGYHLVLRGPSPGAMPDGSVASVSFDQRTYIKDACEFAWGWAGYARPLSQQELSDFELIPDEHNPVRYTQYAVEIKRMERDSAGKRTVTSEWARGADSEVFATSYITVAAKLAKDLNDAALDTNSRDRITKATVRQLNRPGT